MRLIISFYVVMCCATIVHASEMNYAYESMANDIADDIRTIAFAQMCVNLFGFIVLYFTWLNANESNDRSKKVSVAELRPYLNIVDLKVCPQRYGSEEDGQFLYLCLFASINNAGRTPASNVKMHISSLSINQEKNKEHPPECNGPIFIGPDEKKTFRINLLSFDDGKFVGSGEIVHCLLGIDYNSILEEKSTIKWMIQFDGENKNMSISMIEMSNSLS